MLHLCQGLQSCRAPWSPILLCSLDLRGQLAVQRRALALRPHQCFPARLLPQPTDRGRGAVLLQGLSELLPPRQQLRHRHAALIGCIQTAIYRVAVGVQTAGTRW
jgi:hypothetical protein